MFDEILEVSNKKECKGCPLDTKKCKNLVDYKLSDSVLNYSLSNNILILLDHPPEKVQLVLFNNLLKNLSIKADIIVGIDCKIQTPDVIPSPTTSTYIQCNTLKNMDLNKYDVVIASGRSVYSITKSDDLMYYHDFTESNFNPTYFYTKPSGNIYLEGSDDKLIRVYPIPGLHEIISSDWNNYYDKWETEYTKKQLQEAVDHLNNFKEEKLSPYKLVKIDKDKVNEFLQDHWEEKICSWDLETSGLIQFEKDFTIICITMSFDGVTGYYLPFENINKRLLSTFLSSKYNILANGKYDLKCLWVKGIRGIKMDVDVTILYRMSNTERRSNSIKGLSWLIGFGGYEFDLDKYKKLYNVKSYTQIPEPILYPYSVLDSIVTYRLWVLGEKLLDKQPNIKHLFYEYVMPVFEVYLDAEVTGFPIDIDYLNNLNSKYEQKLVEIEAEIKKILGNIKISSLDDLGRALANMGLKNYGTNAKNIYKTGETQLLAWKEDGIEVADYILKYRETAKMLTTYLGVYEGIKEDVEEDVILIIEEDGENKEGNSNSKRDKYKYKGLLEEDTFSSRKLVGLAKHIRYDEYIHHDMSPARAESGRTTHSSPNIANMPKQGNFAKEFRRVFKCPPNYYYGGFDYSGFQLRIACISSKDKNMLDAFINQGGDLHSMTARNVFARHITLEEFMKNKSKSPYKKYRFEAKKINFAFLFGGRFSLLFDDIASWLPEEIEEYIISNKLIQIEQEGKTKEEEKILTVCKDIQEKFFDAYPDLVFWHKRNIDFACKNGYIDSDIGGRRHLSKLMYQGRNVDQKAFANLKNISTNSPTQNFESMVVYKAMRNIYDDLNKYNMKTKIIGMVHDEITHFIYKPEAKDVYEIAHKHMTIPTEVYGCPITAELGVGYIWGFDTEMTEKNAEKFQKGHFFKINYLTPEEENNYYENIAYDQDDIINEFTNKNPDCKILCVEKTH